MSDANNIASTLGLNVSRNTLGTGASLLGDINIVALPPDLQNLDQIQNLEGKILSVQKDGLVMISTERGNVTISTNNPALLQNRKEIELRIEAGNPPTKVVLRPTPREALDTDPTKNFDTRSVQTTLTESAKILGDALIETKQLLSGTPIPITLFGSEETVAQPFMRKTSSEPTLLSRNASSVFTMDSAVEQHAETVMVSETTIPSKLNMAMSNNDGYYRNLPPPQPSSAINTAQLFQNDLQPPPDKMPHTTTEETFLPLQNKPNELHLPFRAVAVHVIGTSEETRISYNYVSQTPADIDQSSLNKATPDKPIPNYSVTNHAEIRVRNIIPPQIGFVDDTSNGNHGINNLHFTPIHTEHGYNNGPASGIINNSQIGQASAIVEGFTQTRNLPVLRMLSPSFVSERLYSLDMPVQNLLMGCQLECEITPLRIDIEKSEFSAGVTDKPIPAVDASQFLTLGKWPIMEEIQQSLVQVNPQTAQAFNASLPSVSTPAQLGAGILFFVAAMRSGDLQSWLGDKAIETLKRSGKGSLLGQVGSELSGISQMNKEKVSGEWRALSIPLVWQNEVHKLAIYTNHGDTDTPDNNEQINKGGKTRFIVDLSLSNIGPLQLDGLFSGSAGDTLGEASGRLDLVLRTEQGFSKAMKQQMRSAYKNALDETRITGELSFQDHTLDWVRITPGETAEYSTDA